MSVDNETLDGFSDFDVSNIIQKLKDHSFAFKPVKRVHLEKPNGKKRPIGELFYQSVIAPFTG